MISESHESRRKTPAARSAQAEALCAFKSRAKQAGIPPIYANDNFGRWRSDFPKPVQYCLGKGIRGKSIVQRLTPDPDDYFILKPKHSAFYQTNLDTLLKYLGVDTVIVTGISGDISVLFTANDAYMRDLKVLVPPDWIASEDPEKNRQVLTRMQRVLNAEIKPSVLASGEMKIAYHARSSAFVWNAYGLYANR